MTRSKTTLISIALPLLMTACGSVETDIDTTGQPESYELQYVEWMLGPDDGETFIEQRTEPLIFVNESPAESEATVDPLEKVNFTSDFTCDDPGLFAALNTDGAMIAVPSHAGLLSPQQWSRMGSGTEVPFALGRSDIGTTTKISQKMLIPAHSRLELNTVVTLRRMSASYRAVCRESGGKPVELTGRWSGSFYERGEFEYVLDPLQ